MPRAKNILFIGDSLVEFFDWGRRFPNHNIRNLGISGETVEELLNRIPGILKENPDPALVFLMTGINNVAIEKYDFLSSYCKILDKLTCTCPEASVYLTSLLPVDIGWIQPEIIRRLNKYLEGIAENSGAEFMDIHKLFLREDGNTLSECLLPDGIHISPLGYAIWSREVEKVIKKLKV